MNPDPILDEKNVLNIQESILGPMHEKRQKRVRNNWPAYSPSDEWATNVT